MEICISKLGSFFRIFHDLEKLHNFTFPGYQYTTISITFQLSLVRFVFVSFNPFFFFCFSNFNVFCELWSDSYECSKNAFATTTPKISRHFSSTYIFRLTRESNHFSCAFSFSVRTFQRMDKRLWSSHREIRFSPEMVLKSYFSKNYLTLFSHVCCIIAARYVGVWVYVLVTYSYNRITYGLMDR